MGEVTVPVVTGLIVGLVALATFLVASMRQRRETLDKKVEREVEAQLGRIYVDFVSAGQKASKEIQKLSHTVSERAEKIIGDATGRLADLESAQALIENLERSLERAESIVPNLAAISAATPAALVQELRDPEISPGKASALIEQIRNHPQARSNQLEAAGDAARLNLGDYPLALELYTASVERDPENSSARAELLSLDLDSGSPEVRDRARTELLSMIKSSAARAKKSNAGVVLFNHFIDNGLYGPMEKACLELLDDSPSDPMLHRNLAVARSELGREPDEVIASFERALEFSRRTDAIDNFINTAKTYAPWLARKGRVAEARAVIDEALQLSQSSVELYLALASVAMSESDPDAARRAAETALKMGNSDQRVSAQRRLLGIAGFVHACQAND